jgi:hypothetical protein
MMSMDRKRALDKLAVTWSLTHPCLASRISRAKGLVDQVKPIGDLTWEVPGETDTYYVYANPATKTSTCTCPDSRSGHKCKHRLAVALAWVLGRM